MRGFRLGLAMVVAVAIGAFVVAAAAAQDPDAESLSAADRARLEAKQVALDAAHPDRAGAASDSRSDGQHADSPGHLLPTQRNVRLVSKLSPTAQFGDIVEGQIADLTVFDDYAYLNSWEEPTCTRGGIYTVNIKRPGRPIEDDFIPALEGNYHGEGAHALSLKTKAFRGDLLAVNNERCADVEAGGGFDLYDVSDPRNPEILVQGFGDTGPEGSLLGDEPVHDSHSVFVWQSGKRAYLAAVDNVELHDVDVFEVTDPRNPVPVEEFDLAEEFPEILDATALNDEVFFHDFVVKEIDGTQTMLASYWDAGYVTLDVDRPAAPTYIGDSSFDAPDPLTGFLPPEGNAHQGEFSNDNRFILSADEDFSPYRAGTFSITTGPNAGQFDSATVGGGAGAAELADLILNGPVVYGGYGCDASAPVPQRSVVDPQLGSGEEAIIVLQRGPADDPEAPEDACFPGEKAANGVEAGWDAVVLVNRHGGSAEADEPLCGSGDFPPGQVIVTVCTTHAAFHRMFGSEPRFEVPYEPGDAPPLGTEGERIEATSEFDGWGYAHLYKNNDGKLREIDAYAIKESLDPRFASGFGDLSIHEFATDPNRRLAYSSYYSGGFRVVRYGKGGLRETGRFIDKGGNNFWGVEQFGTEKNRLIALSDRDFGLYIFEYRGPGSGR